MSKRYVLKFSGLKNGIHEFEYTIDEKSADIRLIAKSALPEYEEKENKRFAVSGLIMAYYYQLNDLIEEYYEYLSVDVIERPV